jgi:hypothetical protein
MARNGTTKGGRQRGEAKVTPMAWCPLCNKERTKRKTKQIEVDGKKVRICKHHPVS